MTIKDVLFTQTITISNQDRNFRGATSIALANLKNDMAQTIVDKKVTVVQKDYHQEISMTLYVMTPDEFWEIVTLEARKMNNP